MMLRLERVRGGEVTALHGMGMLRCKGLLLSCRHGQRVPPALGDSLVRAASAAGGLWMFERGEAGGRRLWLLVGLGPGRYHRRAQASHLFEEGPPLLHVRTVQRQARRRLHARRRLALAMALHARLGQLSALHALGADLVWTLAAAA